MTKLGLGAVQGHAKADQRLVQALLVQAIADEAASEAGAHEAQATRCSGPIGPDIALSRKARKLESGRWNALPTQQLRNANSAWFR
jgi:hypothetical protein